MSSPAEAGLPVAFFEPLSSETWMISRSDGQGAAAQYELTMALNSNMPEAGLSLRSPLQGARAIPKLQTGSNNGFERNCIAVVMIRLARVGARKQPYYRIVVDREGPRPQWPLHRGRRHLQSPHQPGLGRAEARARSPTGAAWARSSPRPSPRSSTSIRLPPRPSLTCIPILPRSSGDLPWSTVADGSAQVCYYSARSKRVIPGCRRSEASR